jgi:acetylornithine deacetylase
VTSHIDVVPPHFPYSVSGSKIFGRGSNDAKGSVATQIQAVEELRKSGKLSDGDIGLLFVVGEEVLSTWNVLMVRQTVLE